ncbi:MAG: hypothetical protein L6Q52_16690, partial [Rhodocyclaceae bacterium]|nr:hypothetical protein [Rhodocyclaceae bacterium]
MTSLASLFEQAQLAEAAYANLVPGTTLLSELQNTENGMRFSLAQATAFVADWQVVDHIPDTASGFSATIFRSTQTGAYTLAIRGSTNLTDFAADAALIARDGLAVQQVADLYNYWQRANTPAGQSYTAARLILSVEPFPSAFQIAGLSYRIEWVNSSQLTDSALRQGTGALSFCPASLNVAGHSLGGHLSMAFTRLCPTLAIDALAVNGLGFKIGNTTVDNLFTALGGGTSFSPGQIRNVYGLAGPEFAAMNNAVLQQPGGFDGIYIESGGLGTVGGHSAVQMTDSLALYSLYGKLGPSLTLASITQLLNSASSTPDRSIENALDALRATFLGTSALTTTKTATDSRESLYANLYALQDSAAYKALKGGAAVRLTATQDAATLAGNARNDFGHFLAVRYLLPVAIEGAGATLGAAHADIYARWQADRALTPEQRQQGLADHSDEYLADRAALLGWKNKLALEDADATTTAYSKGDAPDAWFKDNASNLTINLGSGAAPAAKRRFLFDGDGAGALSGGSKDDRLYGGGGDDVLYGFDGANHLEGNAGKDKLHGGKDVDILFGGSGDDL